MARLARVSLTSEEEKALTEDLEAILTYVDELKKAPVIDFGQGRPVLKNVWREDENAESSKAEGEHYKVKKILG